MQIRDSESIRLLRQRHCQQGGVFRVGDGLAILDPRTAQEVNSDNYEDAALPDRLVDLLRFRDSRRVPWREIRAAWSDPLRRLTGPRHLLGLMQRLSASIDRRVGPALDLPRAIQEIFSRALLPMMMAGQTPAERRILIADQDLKLARLMRRPPRESRLSERLLSMAHQVAAGLVTRRVLRGRRSGQRARQVDLADPMVDLIPEVGMDRAVHAVTTVLTAISGPPGAVAVCMLLELCRQPRHREEIAREQAGLTDGDILTAPLKAAPVSHRFVKEVLRLWSAPTVLTRVARVPLRVEGHRLAVEDLFHLSPHFGHHDPSEWDEPETFDPDRWLPGSGRGPRHACAYAPFGYAPTSCIGAGIGLIELILLLRLCTTRFRVEPEGLDEVVMEIASVPLPLGLRGRFVRS